MLTLLTSIVISTATLAAPICPPNRSQIQGPSEIKRFFDRINIFNNPDRKTASEFAKEDQTTVAEVEKRYSASGDLICGNMFSQAQVVLKNDVIVTAAHSLFRDDCNSAFKLSDCKFAISEGGKRKFYDLAKQEGAGYKCPNPNKIKNTEDWTVLRLKKPVGNSVKPYKIGTPPCADSSRPTDVVRVAKSDDFGLKQGEAILQAPRHYGHCQVQRFKCGDSKVLFSDCDSSFGASGGGTFIGGREPQLVGIVAGSANTCPGDAKLKTGTFKYDCWSSLDAAITGEFRSEILKATGEESSDSR